MVAILQRTLYRQPATGSSGATINTNHTLANGLGFFPSFMSNGPAVCLVNGSMPNYLGPSTKTGINGGVYNNTTTDTSFFEWSYPWVGSLFGGRGEISYAVMITSQTGSAGGTSQTRAALFSMCEAAGGGAHILGNTDTNIGGYFNLVQWTFSGFSSFSLSKTYLFVYSGGATASQAMIFSDGGLYISASLAALSTTSSSLSRIRIANERGTSAGGAGSISNFAFVGSVHYAAAWNRRLSQSEMFQLASDPYAFVTVPYPSRPFTTISTQGRWGVPSSVGVLP